MSRTFRGSQRRKLKNFFKKSHQQSRKQIYFDKQLKQAEEYNVRNDSNKHNGDLS